MVIEALENKAVERQLSEMNDLPQTNRDNSLAND